MTYQLTLLIRGRAAPTETAIRNLRKICETHLPGQCDLEVIDLLENPVPEWNGPLLVTPLLVRRSPAPERKIIGDFGDHQAVLAGLGMLSAAPARDESGGFAG